MAIGTLSGSLLTVIFNVLAARILGPRNFGNLGLVVTVSGIIGVPMGMCQLGALKYGSGAQDDSVRSRIISTLILQVAFITVGSIAMYLLFSAQLSNVFGISAKAMAFAITYATIIAFFGLNGIFQRILFRIRVVALLNVLQSAVVLAAFLIFISTNMRSWQAAMFSPYIGNVLLNVIFIVHLRQYVRLQFDRFWSWKILSYAVITLPASITAALTGVDRMLIHKFITTAAVGIYNAYYLPSISVSLALWGVVNIAFFPFASKSKDKLGTFRNVNKAVRYYYSDAILLSHCNIAKNLLYISVLC